MPVNKELAISSGVLTKRTCPAAANRMRRVATIPQKANSGLGLHV